MATHFIEAKLKLQTKRTYGEWNDHPQRKLRHRSGNSPAVSGELQKHFRCLKSIQVANSVPVRQSVYTPICILRSKLQDFRHSKSKRCLFLCKILWVLLYPRTEQNYKKRRGNLKIKKKKNKKKRKKKKERSCDEKRAPSEAGVVPFEGRV